MDVAFMLGILIVILIYVILILFLVSIPVFSFTLYRRVSKKMSPSEKSVFGFIVVLINVFVVFGSYIFMFKDMFK